MDTHQAKGTTWLMRLRQAIAGAVIAGLAFGGVAAIDASTSDSEPVEEAATWSFRVKVKDVDDDDKFGPTMYARATWS